MGQALRYEDPEVVYLITIRTVGSRLWLVNNRKLTQKLLAALARYQERYKVILYGFTIQGNHPHFLAQFPLCNRAAFMQAWASMAAKLVAKYVPEFEGGKLWARRYSCEAVLTDDDIKHWFYYCALNPVLACLVSDIKEYPNYNSFWDAIRDRKRTFKWYEKAEYTKARQAGRKVSPKEFIKTHTLEFSRLPGYEHYTTEENAKILTKELYERQSEAVKDILDSDRKFANAKILKTIKPGSKPKKTKTSHRYSFRPLVLSLCKEAKKRYLDLYFEVVDRYRQAVVEFKAGVLNVVFPSGTYRPITFTNLVETS